MLPEEQQKLLMLYKKYFETFSESATRMMDAVTLPKWVGSVAEMIKASFLRRPWSHDMGSILTLVALLRRWIRRFTMIIFACWLRTSSKFSGQEIEENHRNIGSMETFTQIPSSTK